MLKISKMVFAAATMTVPAAAIATPVPAAVMMAPHTAPAQMVVQKAVPAQMVAPRPAVTMSVSWSVDGVRRYGTVKCTPNHTCGEHIRPW